jgi:hypothetical protein
MHAETDDRPFPLESDEWPVRHGGVLCYVPCSLATTSRNGQRVVCGARVYQLRGYFNHHDSSALLHECRLGAGHLQGMEPII